MYADVTGVSLWSWMSSKSSSVVSEMKVGEGGNEGGSREGENQIPSTGEHEAAASRHFVIFCLAKRSACLYMLYYFITYAAVFMLLCPSFT